MLSNGKEINGESAQYERLTSNTHVLGHLQFLGFKE